MDIAIKDLNFEEIETVDGAFLPLIGAAVALVGVTVAAFGVGYNVGKDIALNENDN